MRTVPSPGAPRGLWSWQGIPAGGSSFGRLTQRWQAAVGLGAMGVGIAMCRPELASQGLAWAQSLGKISNAGSALSCACLPGPFASLSFSSGTAQAEEVTDPKTGMTFPGILSESQVLTGIGLRKKSILGLKKIDIYAFGVYADPESLKSMLGEKYGNMAPEKLKDKEFYEEVVEKDVGLTVHMVIVYGSLKISSMRGAFEESVGGRIKKFNGGEDRELLARFTSVFKDDIQLPHGTVIDLTRLPGHVLETKIDGKEVGSVQSPLLCRSLFDLYIGEDPLDKQAKEAIGVELALLVTQ